MKGENWLLPRKTPLKLRATECTSWTAVPSSKVCQIIMPHDKLYWNFKCPFVWNLTAHSPTPLAKPRVLMTVLLTTWCLGAKNLSYGLTNRNQAHYEFSLFLPRNQLKVHKNSTNKIQRFKYLLGLGKSLVLWYWSMNATLLISLYDNHWRCEDVAYFRISVWIVT